jgi:hypothetical protein
MQSQTKLERTAHMFAVMGAGMDAFCVAEIWVELMGALGYDRFAA